MRNPGTSAVLSAVIPGIGQFYNGDFLRGIFWLIVTPGHVDRDRGPVWLGVPCDRGDDGVSPREDEEPD